MFKIKTIVILLTISFFPFLNNFAQDSNKVEWEEEFDFNGWDNDEQPFMEINYGLTNLYLQDFNQKFAKHSAVELKLGYSSIDSMDIGSLVEYKDGYTFISNISTDFNLKSQNVSPFETKLNLWQLGFASREAYGFKTGGLLFVPYYGMGFNWSKLNFSTPNIRTYLPVDVKAIEKFENSIRFGRTNEAGVLLGFGESLSLNAGYEYSLIFPRYLIWKHLGSIAIELSAQSLLDHFIDGVLDNSPYATPVVNFVLKNALAYGFFSLKKGNMFWPFHSENPLTLKTFKVGLSYRF